MDRDLFLRCDAATKEKYSSFPQLKREFQGSLYGDLEYCVVDLETTGFQPGRDRIIEVAAVRASGDQATGRISSLIDPGVTIPPQITLLTGIDQDTVEGAPSLADFFDEFAEFLGDSLIVAYSRLEEAFLGHLYPVFDRGKFSNPYLDAMDLAIMLMPSLKGHRQIDLARVFEVEVVNAHRAEDDVDTLFSVFNVLLNGLYNTPLPVLKALTDHAPARKGGLSHLLGRVLEERSGGRKIEGLKLERAVRKDRFWEDIPPLEGSGTHTGTGRERLRSYFDSSASLAGQFDDYEERDEQLQMAEAVSRTLDQGEILLVEAGTGTGKSLAYLVPCVLWAKSAELPLVVSTRTLNLQDQLFTKDLPGLESALGHGSFRYSVLKGYNNYICLRKLQALISGGKRLSEGQLGILGMLINWVTENETGDVSLLNVTHLRGLDEQVMANHRECPGGRCSFARNGCCFYRKALYRARRSHIVVVNHSLLLTGVNLPFRTAVIDEAHSLEDAATEQFTAELDYREARRFLEGLFSPVDGSGFLADIETGLKGQLEPEALDRALFEVGEVKEAVELCLEGLEKVFIALSDMYDGDGSGLSEVRFSQGQIESMEYSRLQSHAEAFAADMDRLYVRLSRALAAVRDLTEAPDRLEYMAADLEGKAVRASEFESVTGLVLSNEDDGRVRWASVGVPDRFDQQSLKASPIHVGEILAEVLFGELDSIVLTSATLTVNGSFDFFRSRVGLDMLEDRRLEEVILDSSFDFRRQMQILILHDMPEPGTEGYEDSLARVISAVIPAAGGGVLVLFTNRKLMLSTHARVADDLHDRGYPVLCQVPGHSRRRLAEEFVDDPGASLFGTASFWEGVDARGSTLRLVVVTRVPFESPGRPVFEARSEKVRIEGGSDFMSLSLPLAALKLKQGVGRLIRTRQDTGQVLLLDSRINSMRYGQILLRSLPPGRRRKVSLDEVERAVTEFHVETDTD